MTQERKTQRDSQAFANRDHRELTEAELVQVVGGSSEGGPGGPGDGTGKASPKLFLA